MTFVPKKAGEWELFYPKKTANEAFVTGAALDWPASVTGYAVKATNATTKFAGISQNTITSADGVKYTGNAVIAALRPNKGTKRPILVATAAGAAVTAVGLRCDLTDEVTVDIANSNVGRVVVDEFYSATSLGVHFLEPTETGST